MTGSDWPSSSFADHRPLLVGRAREQALLHERLDALLAGQGSLILIGGEAGIGKTALAEAFAREATFRGVLVLTGRCYDRSATAPYGPWSELFTCISPPLEIPPLLSDIAMGGIVKEITSPATLFARIQDVLRSIAAHRPAVLLLDDLQWADQASLDLLRFLARQSTLLPVILLVTYRADALTRRHPLYGLIPVLVHDAPALRLDLRRLDEEAVRGFVQVRFQLSRLDEDRLVSYLDNRAEGNPFFIHELLRTFEEEGLLRRVGGSWALGDLAQVRVPPFLRQVIEGRLACLGEEARELLAVAAVIGQEVPLSLWSDVAAVVEERLLDVVERGVEAHLLADSRDGTSMCFVHALIRDALYESLSGPRRRMWHRRVGTELLTQPSPDPDTVAYHLQQASDAGAVPWLIRAGERAQRAYAWLMAAARFEMALALMAGSATVAQDRGWLLARLAWLRRYANPQQAVRYLDDALEVAAEGNDPVLTASATFYRGIFRCYIGEFGKGLAELEAGVTSLDALATGHTGLRTTENTGGLLEVLDEDNGRGSLALCLAYAGRYCEALNWGPSVALHTAPRVSREMAASSHGDAYHGLGLAHAALGRPCEARQAFDLARDAYRAVEHHFMVGYSALYELHWTLLPYHSERVAERHVLAKVAEEAWTRASAVWSDLQPRLVQLPLLALEGQWGEAREVATLAVSSEGMIHQRCLGLQMLGLLARAQGDVDLAWAQVRELLPEGPASEPGETLFLIALTMQRLAAALALDVGDLAGAQAWLNAHDRWLTWGGTILGQAEAEMAWASYHRAAGHSFQAYERARRALARAAEPRQPLALLEAHRLLGELETETGRFSQAALHLEQALALSEACRAPFERARTLLALAELHHLTGDLMQARELLGAVSSICEPLGAQPTLARAGNLAATLANSVTSTSRGPAGLTAREVDVLRLVAQGLTDAQVAECLSLSPRTVGRHLASIYSKLGVSSRMAASRFVVEHQLS